jgi:hypothetical protein
VRQIDDVAGRRYVFFNHGCSSRLTRCLSQTSFAQTFSPPLKFYRRNWGGRQASPRGRNPALFCDTIDRVSANCVRSRSLFSESGVAHSHFLNLKIQYGTIAAISIITSAIG